MGYRRLAGFDKGGTWIARRYDRHAKPKMTYLALGTADDFNDANDHAILNFAQAQKKAITWCDALDCGLGVVVRPITVRDAMADYMIAYKAGATRGKGKGKGKRPKDTQTKIDAHILPALGDRLVQSLTRADVSAWHEALAAAPARLRSGPKTIERKVRVIDTEHGDPDVVADLLRRRNATANRVLTVLKAALTRAYELDRVPSNAAWAKVKPFGGADAGRVRYLADHESRALVAACPADLATLVTAALLTGADYSELGRVTVRNVECGTRTLTVQGKRGERFIRLSDDAVAFFERVILDKEKTDVVFLRTDGSRWTQGVYFRDLHAACDEAKVAPRIGFHILRHTYATRMLRRGMPMHLLSKQLGHASVVMTMKHYAHIAPDDVLASIQAISGSLDLRPASVGN